MDTTGDAVRLIEDAKRAMVKTNDIAVARPGAFAALDEAQRVLRGSSQYMAHLEKCAAEVATWPAWKRGGQ